MDEWMNFEFEFQIEVILIAILIYISFSEIRYLCRSRGLDTTKDIYFVFLCSLLMII